MNTFDHIYALARQIPYGTVATYGQLARLAGNPRMSRVVGYGINWALQNLEIDEMTALLA